MKHLDFLSSAPTIYLLNNKKGKNKVGGFFSLFFIIVMLMITIYYLYIFFFGLEYSLTYYKDNWTTKLTEEEEKSIREPKLIGFLFQKISNNAKLRIEIPNEDNEDLIKKCNDNLEIDPNGDWYCFNLSFYHLDKNKPREVYMSCRENCYDSEGNPSYLTMSIMTHNLRIDHKSKNPLSKTKLYGDTFTLATNYNLFVNYIFEFTPILYTSTEVLNTKENKYIDTYFYDSVSRMIFSKPYGYFFSFNLAMNTNVDIYRREYNTLFDTISKIGGLFSPFKLLFDILVMFYSDYENNSEIAKSVFLKRDKYKYKMQNNISLENKLYIEPQNEKNELTHENNLGIETSNEAKISRKKFNINKGEQ